jgi:hypothetical protein
MVWRRKFKHCWYMGIIIDKRDLRGKKMFNNSRLNFISHFFLNKNFPDGQKEEFDIELAKTNYLRNKNLSILLFWFFCFCL